MVQDEGSGKTYFRAIAAECCHQRIISDVNGGRYLLSEPLTEMRSADQAQTLISKDTTVKQGSQDEALQLRLWFSRRRYACPGRPSPPFSASCLGLKVEV